MVPIPHVGFAWFFGWEVDKQDSFLSLKTFMLHTQSTKMLLQLFGFFLYKSQNQFKVGKKYIESCYSTYIEFIFLHAGRPSTFNLNYRRKLVSDVIFWRQFGRSCKKVSMYFFCSWCTILWKEAIINLCLRLVSQIRFLKCHTFDRLVNIVTGIFFYCLLFPF